MSDTTQIELPNPGDGIVLPLDPPSIPGIVMHGILGRGGMGAVYRGLHTRLCIPVAVKILTKSLGVKGDLANEARLAAKVNHPNVARVYDVNRDQGITYIVQEFVEGESAGDLIERFANAHENMLESRALEIAADAARGLAAIHAAGIIHLDVKPDNILVQAHDGLAKIVDLGLARHHQPLLGGSLPEGKQATNFVSGTPGYMSPEQVQGIVTGPSADIYALGSTLYELLTLCPAFPGGHQDLLDIVNRQIYGPAPDPRAIRAEVSAESAAIVMRCLAVLPEDRFASASALLDAILHARARVLSAGNAPQPPPNPAEETMTVVCVDDDPGICEYLKDVLSGIGHLVFSFPAGGPALDHLSENTPDLIMLDMELPGANGLKVCNAIRAIERCRDVPIIFMSGNNDLNAIDAAMALGATDYIVKPMGPDDLLARVRCLTRMAQLQRERDALVAQYQSMSARFKSASGRSR